MRRIVVNRFSGVLSAYGIHLADIVIEKQEPCASLYSAEAVGGLKERLDALEASAIQELRAQGFPEKEIRIERFMNLRFAGTDCALMTTTTTTDDGGEDDYGKVSK